MKKYLALALLGLVTLTGCAGAAASAPVLLSGSTTTSASTAPEGGSYGASAVTEDESLSLADMLTHAMEDEYLAEGEYRLIMDEYGTQQPFSNIMQAELTHQAWLEELMTAYDVALPDKVEVQSQVHLPESIAVALEAGVQAEIANIAMYDRFLQETLPDDVRSVFERLKAASENHLSAFQRSVGQGGYGSQGRGQGGWGGRR